MSYLGRILTTFTLLLVILKITGIVTWSWFWILSPTWIPIAIFIIIFFWSIFKYMR